MLRHATKTVANGAALGMFGVDGHRCVPCCIWPPWSLPVASASIREFYLRLQARGKCKKVALTACMRKLLTMLNAMIKSNTPWCAEVTVTT